MKKIIILALSIFMLSTLTATTIYDIQYTEDGSGDSPFDGETVTITGIVTAVGYNFANDNFFISHPDGGEWNGIYIYGAGIEPILGDEVGITGRVIEYQGITEISIISNANIISFDNPLPEPTVISTNELATEEKYESVLVQIQNVTVTQDVNDDEEWYVDDGSGECQIDNNIYTYSNIVVNLQFESIVGVIDEYMNEFALIPRDENDFVVSEDTTPPTIESATAMSATSVNIVFNEMLNETSATNLSNYSIENLDIIEAELSILNTVILATSTQTENENYTITINNVADLAGNLIEGYQTNFIGFSDYTQIADIQNNLEEYDGQEVTVRGVITIGAGVSNNNLLNAFIQDSSGKGIMLFDYDITSAYEADLIRGNMLQVSGEVDEYNGVTELKDFSYTVISSGNPDPAATILDLGINLDNYEGTLVQATGTIYEMYYAGGGINLNIEDENGNQLTVRVWDSTGLDLDEYVDGYILEARGAGGMYNGDFQILAGYEDHLEEGEFVNYPYGDISEIIPGEPVNITFSRPLEFDNVIMHWKTSSDIGFNLLEMTPTEANENIYEADVPAQGEGTIVEFYIVAVDTSSEEYTFPEEYPQVSAYFYTYKATSHSAILNIPAKVFDPYNGETFPIEFASKNGDRAILRIYNAEGKLMRTLVNRIISNSTGIIQYDWDGKDRENNLLPLGLYICFLEITDTTNGNKKTAKAPIVIGAPLK